VGEDRPARLGLVSNLLDDVPGASLSTSDAQLRLRTDLTFQF